MAKLKDPCSHIEAKGAYKTCLTAYKKRINTETLKIGLRQKKQEKWKVVSPKRTSKRKHTAPKKFAKVFDNCDATSGFGCKATTPPASFKHTKKPLFTFDYTTATEPCANTRKTCPVQLHFKKGKPFLRFCIKQGKKGGTPGYTMPVKSVEEAQKIAAKACECWFESSKTPSRRSFNKCKVSSGPLGSTRKKRRRKKRK